MTAVAAALKERYVALAEMIGAPKALVGFPEGPALHDGSHIEYAGSSFYYVVTERGIEFERRRAKDTDELLYWLLRDLTFQMACDWELKHRREEEDFRRQLFAKQLELLGRLKEEWRQALASDLESTLAEHPYRDEKAG